MMDKSMDKQQNRMVVHEVMQSLNVTVTKLLPEVWLRRWTDPEVDAEALIRSLADSVEDLWMHVDALVFQVQEQELSPEEALAQAHEHLVAMIHQLLPAVELRQREWRSRKIGTLIELATYQLTIERLLADLREISQRLPQSSRALAPTGMPMGQQSSWQSLIRTRDVPLAAQREERFSGPGGFGGFRPQMHHANHAPASSDWASTGAPTGWVTDGRPSERETTPSDQPLRRIRVTRRFLVDGQVVREDVAETEVPLAIDGEAAVAAVQAQLPPWLPEETPRLGEPSQDATSMPHGSSAA